MNFNIKKLIIERKENNNRLIIVAIISMILLCTFFFVTIKLETDLLFLAFLSLGINIVVIYKIIDYNLEIQQLEDTLKSLNTHQLSEISDAILYCRGEYIFTRQSIYLLKTKKFVKYNDLLLAYEKYNISRYLTGKSNWRTIHNSFEHDRSVVLITVTKKAIRLCNDKSRFVFFESPNFNDNPLLLNKKILIDLIRDKNSNILIGNTKENKRILKEKYGMNLDCLKYFG